jgi:hypothetical protein
MGKGCLFPLFFVCSFFSSTYYWVYGFNVEAIYMYWFYYDVSKLSTKKKKKRSFNLQINVLSFI